MEKNILKEIFGQAVFQGRKIHNRSLEQSDPHFKNRLAFFGGILLIAFLILSGRLFWLTVVKGSYYRQLSQNNRLRENILPAPRGVITDRKGEILVRNKPASLVKIPCGQQECYQRLTHEEILKLEAENKLSWLTLGVAREYPEETAFSHLLGFVGQLKKEEINQNYCGRKLNYSDEIGRLGIEKAFDCQLKGKQGRELYEIDALGNKVKTLSYLEAVPGQNLTLSIDKELQLKAQEALNNRNGAVIAHNPQTGEIFVLYSSPSFDLAKFADGLSQTEYDKLINDPNKPLFNRAIAGVYPPGSTFKPLLAAAALEEQVITKTTQVEDVGVLTVGRFSFGNWYFSQYGRKEGLVNVVKALARSNDIFFYKVGEWLGVEKIAGWAKKFKLGQTLGIEIAGEEKGLVPDASWKQAVMKEQWFLGDTYHYAIGQGNLLVTPLQIAFALGSFGNEGIICQPTLLKKNSCLRLTDKLYSANTLALVKEGMIAACQAGGTAYPFFHYQVNGREIKVACKTGTAEFGDPQNKTHAWFFALAPADNPQLAVTVLVEAGGEGSAVAAPIAKEIFDAWFN